MRFITNIIALMLLVGCATPKRQPDSVQQAYDLMVATRATYNYELSWGWTEDKDMAKNLSRLNRSELNFDAAELTLYLAEHAVK